MISFSLATLFTYLMLSPSKHLSIQNFNYKCICEIILNTFIINIYLFWGMHFYDMELKTE